MIDTSDTKYILSEIRNIPYYTGKIQQIDNLIESLEKEIELSALPQSLPTDRIKAGRMSVHDNTSSIEDKLLSLISKQHALRREQKKWNDRLSYAQQFKDAMLSCDDSEFVRDYMNGSSYRTLEMKYFISNAYLRLCRIIRNNVSDSML